MARPNNTQESFLKAAKAVHGTRYTYARARYVASRIKIIITCRKHGDFKQDPRYHTTGSGCPVCADTRDRSMDLKCRSSTSEFIEKARLLHGKTFDYSKVTYINSITKVTITCKIHGEFNQSPTSHLNGRGCRECSIISGSLKRTGLGYTVDDFKRNAKLVHGTTYAYTKSKYVDSQTPVVITCKVHGDFKQSPNNHVQGQGCPGCVTTGRHSKVAIDWIESEAHSRRLKNVQHAGNGGEYVIPGTRLRVDGYHKASNTVFEFYGDCFHGNPEVYRPRDKPNPFSDLTAAKLYRQTMERSALLKALGYNIVEKWELAYRGGKHRHNTRRRKILI